MAIIFKAESRKRVTDKVAGDKAIVIHLGNNLSMGSVMSYSSSFVVFLHGPMKTYLRFESRKSHHLLLFDTVVHRFKQPCSVIVAYNDADRTPHRPSRHTRYVTGRRLSRRPAFGRKRSSFRCPPPTIIGAGDNPRAGESVETWGATRCLCRDSSLPRDREQGRIMGDHRWPDRR